jgi:hypothetical protein
VPERAPEHWIDEPPPQKDLELGNREANSLADSAAQRGREEGYEVVPYGSGDEY